MSSDREIGIESDGAAGKASRRHLWALPKVDPAPLLLVDDALSADWPIPDSEVGPEKPAGRERNQTAAGPPALTALEGARIAALILRGQTARSDIIKSMPGYQGRRYNEFARLYDELEAAIRG
jgi:hypothetical protein